MRLDFVGLRFIYHTPTTGVIMIMRECVVEYEVVIVYAVAVIVGGFGVLARVVQQPWTVWS